MVASATAVRMRLSSSPNDAFVAMITNLASIA
jgi:hypothetical protein